MKFTRSDLDRVAAHVHIPAWRISRLATFFAPRSGKTAGENAAVDVLAKLLLDISGETFAAVFFREGKEGREMFAHDAMKKSRLFSPQSAEAPVARLRGENGEGDGTEPDVYTGGLRRSYC